MASQATKFKLVNKKSMHHLKRVVTALITAPLLVLLILRGTEPVFSFLVLVIVSVGLWEYFSFAEKSGLSVPVWLGILLGTLIVLTSYRFSFPHMLFALVLAITISLTYFMLNFHTYGNPFCSAGIFITGLVYIPFFLSHLVFIRHLAMGRIWVIFLMAVVFAGDIAAYYVGSLLGRHKLYKSVSPGKTIEGAIGGLAASVATAYLFRIYLLDWLSPLQTLTIAITIAVTAQIGDLVESMLKRAVGVKDSGRILPGHGGMLDRMDGVIFSSPLLFYELLFFLR